MNSLLKIGGIASTAVFLATLLTWLLVRYLHPLEPMNASETAIVLIFWSIAYAVGRYAIKFARSRMKQWEQRDEERKSNP